MVFNFAIFDYNEIMQFELTEELINEIIFFMEDQNGDFCLDTRKGIIISRDDDEFDDDDFGDAEFNDNDDDDEEGRFISLPDWQPSDGFRLMESFAAGLHNPVVRKHLSAALNRGRGVFRAFKDAISEYPEVEKLWFSYKDREMKREVIRWYNSLREQWGMELIGEEPEDIDDLALEDFSFRDGSAADTELAKQLHRSCIDVAENEITLSPYIFPGDMCIVAENSGGEFAAYICAAKTESESGGLHVNALEVKPEYRGLGLGKTLLARLLKQADSRNISRISIDLPAESETFSRVLSREDFQPVVTRYCRKTSLP